MNSRTPKRIKAIFSCRLVRYTPVTTINRDFNITNINRAEFEDKYSLLGKLLFQRVPAAL